MVLDLQTILRKTETNNKNVLTKKDVRCNCSINLEKDGWTGLLGAIKDVYPVY